MTEQVLVIPRAVLEQCGPFVGLQRVDTTNMVVSRFRPLFDPANQKFMPRDEAENNPEWKQLIPYVIVSPWNQGIANYWRGKGQGEARLHGKRSLGFGGHINPDDAPATPGYEHLAKHYYSNGMRRELSEELTITNYPSNLAMPVIGFINDDSNDVGKVHLGVVHFVELPPVCAIAPNEPDIVDLACHDLEVLHRARAEFESWSQLCIDTLIDEYRMSVQAAKRTLLDDLADDLAALDSRGKIS